MSLLSGFSSSSLRPVSLRWRSASATALEGVWAIGEIAKMILLVGALSFLFRTDAKLWFGRKS